MNTIQEQKENLLLCESEIRKKFKERITSYSLKKVMHLHNYRKNLIIYYVCGIVSTIFSTVISFITGVYTIRQLDPLLLLTLVLSLTVSIIHSLLQFTHVNEKTVKHRDAYEKYDELSMDIKTFLLSSGNQREDEHFMSILIEKEKLIKNYELVGCCTSS
jgi:hypothetical protein